MVDLNSNEQQVRGAFVFDTSRLRESKEIVAQDARSIATSFQSVNQSIQKAAGSTISFGSQVQKALGISQTSVEGLRSAVKGNAQELQKYIATAAGISKANPFIPLEKSVELVTNALQGGRKELNALAKEIGIPARELQKAVKEAGNLDSAIRKINAQRFKVGADPIFTADFRIEPEAFAAPIKKAKAEVIAAQQEIKTAVGATMGAVVADVKSYSDALTAAANNAKLVTPITPRPKGRTWDEKTAIEFGAPAVNQIQLSSAAMERLGKATKNNNEETARYASLATQLSRAQPFISAETSAVALARALEGGEKELRQFATLFQIPYEQLKKLVTEAKSLEVAIKRIDQNRMRGGSPFGPLLIDTPGSRATSTKEAFSALPKSETAAATQSVVESAGKIGGAVERAATRTQQSFKTIQNETKRAASGFAFATQVIAQETFKVKSGLDQMGNAAAANAEKTKRSAGIITDAVQSIADRIRAARSEAERFSQSNLGVISKAFGDIADKTKYFSLAASGFAVQGLRSADSINSLRIRFAGMVGTQEKAEKLMAEIGSRARELGQPMRAAQEAAAALLPQLNGNVDALKTYMGLASRLSTLNVNEGLAGASFAIREAISSGGTDLVSLAERFNISKKQLRAEIEAAKKSGLDETAAFASALDKVLNKMGLTEAVAEELSNSFGNQLRVAFEEVNLAAGEMFGPMLKDVVSGIRAFSSFVSELRQSHPEILKIAAAGTLAVAALSPMSFAISKIIAGFAAMKATALGTFAAIKANYTLLNANAASWKSAGLGTKLGVGAAAIGTGVVLGGAFTNSLARDYNVQGGDFDRIRKGEDALSIAGERFKQLIVVLVAGLVELARGLAKVGAFLLNAFDQVVNIIKLGASLLRESWLRTIEAFGNVLSAIGDLLARIPGQENNILRDAGVNIAAQANTDLTNLLIERGQLIDRLREGFALPTETENSIDNAFDQLGASVVNALNGFFFPVQEAGRKVEQGLTQLGRNIANAVDEPTFSDDMLDAWADFQDELADIEADAQAEREKAIAKHEEEKKRLEAEQLQARLQAVEDFNRRATEDQIKLGWKISDIQAEFDNREAEEARKFRQEERKRNRDHRENLFRLAASLDARGVYFELRKHRAEGKERERAANQAKQQRQRELDQRIAQMHVEFAREQELKTQNFYNVELPRLQAQQAEQLAAFEASHQERLIQIKEQAKQQSAAAEEAFVDTFNSILEQEGTHQDMMLKKQREGQEAMEAELLAWWKRQAEMFGNTSTSTGNRSKQEGYPGGNPYSPNPGGYPGGNPYAPNIPLPPNPNNPGFFPDLAGAASLAMTAARSVRQGVQSSFVPRPAAAGATMGGRASINAPISVTVYGNDIDRAAKEKLKREVKKIFTEILKEVE